MPFAKESFTLRGLMNLILHQGDEVTISRANDGSGRWVVRNKTTSKEIKLSGQDYERYRNKLTSRRPRK
ncbi:hypothetical protein C5B42_03945 [Candidatus Cerribacteria bacterium 'Amazon FNV 2010 28 9']|uniref:Uncharacterized protein n=1 Tax=Candidatus Cerribacteria bacterium 'Amazon FNV 2010 28 9' TaxID=2081795 RepID=A0A317JNC2_9BACT|nr:MAG: hypothetical protein C5B42_03945 [Candidatus Cerribacteria bacterium 'Amazon FNV 2010 28 9']